MSKFMSSPVRNIGLFFILTLLITGCVGPAEIPEPENLIAEENYIDLLIEMQHIKTYRDAQPDSVNADSLKTIIYQKYGVSDEQFLASHQYYQKHVGEQLERVDEVIRRLDAEEQYIQAHIDSIMGRETQKDSLGQRDYPTIE